MSDDNKGNKPVFKFNAGSVKGSVFINTTKDNSWFSTKIVKSYNEGTKKSPEYKETNNFNTYDLADLMLVSQECYRYARTHFADDEE